MTDDVELRYARLLAELAPAQLVRVVAEAEAGRTDRLIKRVAEAEARRLAHEVKVRRRRELYRRRAAKKGIPARDSQAYRDKLSRSIRAKFEDPAYRALQLAKLTEAMARPEVRAKLRRPRQPHFKPESFREGCRARWRDPAYRERVITNLKRTLAAKRAPDLGSGATAFAPQV